MERAITEIDIFIEEEDDNIGMWRTDSNGNVLTLETNREPSTELRKQAEFIGRLYGAKFRLGKFGSFDKPSGGAE